MLRQDRQGEFVKQGFLFASYRFRSGDLQATKKLNQRQYADLLERQREIPAIVMQREDTTWWMFRDEFYRGPVDYTVDMVRARVKYGIGRPIPEDRNLRVITRPYRLLLQGLVRIAKEVEEELVSGAETQSGRGEFCPPEQFFEVSERRVNGLMAEIEQFSALIEGAFDGDPQTVDQLSEDDVNRLLGSLEGSLRNMLRHRQAMRRLDVDENLLHLKQAHVDLFDTVLSQTLCFLKSANEQAMETEGALTEEPSDSIRLGVELDIEEALKAISKAMRPFLPPLEETIAPHSLSEYIGQERIRESLQVAVEAARSRGDRLDHTLVWGRDGVGKAALAQAIIREMGVPAHTTSGAGIARGDELRSVLSNLSDGQILFVERVETLTRTTRQVLIRAMRDFEMDFSFGSGQRGQTVCLTIPRFTMLATATDVQKVPRQLLSAFGEVHHLTPLTPENLQILVSRAADAEMIDIDRAAALEIARRAGGLPRSAIRLLKRVRDYAQVRADGVITLPVARQALSQLGIGESVDQVSGSDQSEGRDTIPEWMRRAVLDRDQGICRYCGQRAMTLHLDHIEPVAQGGRSTVANLVTSCAECNLKKGGRTPEEAGMEVLPPRTLNR